MSATLTIPNFYRQPLGLPLYWRDEVSGVLAAAVTAYLEHVAWHRPAPSDEQLELLWEYVAHHIGAPCWDHHSDGDYDEQLARLRKLAAARGGIAELRAYVQHALELALDPF